MKRLFSFLALLFSVTTLLMAQMVNPVKWTTTTKQNGNTLVITYSASIQEHWHLYNMSVPEGGPEKTSLTFEKLTGAKLQGPATFISGKPITTYDDAFGMDLTYYEGKAAIQQKVKLTGGDYEIEGYLTYMSCCDGMCTPPTNEEFSFKGTFEAPAKAEEPAAEEPVAETTATAEEPQALAAAEQTATVPAAADSAQAPAALPEQGDLWAPVIDELQAFENGTASSDDSGQTHSWWYILIAGFIAGLLAVVTPCVWPMIPMTMSFFLKRNKKNRNAAIREALIYGASIIVIYVLLGLLITSIFGASALNSLSTNAVFNIIFFLLLVVFALSFFGAFEITLPESWTTKLDATADDLSAKAKKDNSLKGSLAGLLSIFFMAFTLCLVSFSCTGPIIGTLLVETATSGSMLYPAIGMFGFAFALALPFALIAMFPQMLNSMPSSGGWLNMVKVVLGFCELALAFKFLSVADLAYGWHILDRETFLCLWIVIFALLGMYLLGFIRLPHDDDPAPSDRVSVTRLMMALVSFSFAIYMVPGLWGAPCKAISAFAPPMTTQDFNLYNDEIHPDSHDFEEAIAKARREGKPVMVDFSGFGCVNCRKMEAAVWTAPEVKDIIEKEYVLVELMVDDKTPLPGGTQIVHENGKDVKLRTVGDKWSYLQRSKFGANAQPFYVLLDADGHPLTGSYSYNEDIPAYVEFLRSGLKGFKK